MRTSRTKRQAITAAALTPLVALLLTACGDDDPRPAETTPATTPTTELTAPPTQSPEEETAAALEAMYVEIQAASDALAERAAEFDDPDQNLDEANEILLALNEAGATSIAAGDLAGGIFAASAAGLNATGSSVVTAFEATVHLEPVEGQTQPSATATACVDTSQVGYVVAETGEPYDGPRVGNGMQQTLTFFYLTDTQAADASDGRVGREGWYLTVMEDEVVQQC